MKNTNKQSEIIEQVKKTLENCLGVELVIVYGSAVTNSFRSDSDVDVAVLFEKSLSPDTKIDLLGKLSIVLRRSVDLVDLNAVNGTLLKQILTKGRIVYKKNDAAVYRLLKRMIYNQSDFMPYYNRAVKKRVEEFTNG